MPTLEEYWPSFTRTQAARVFGPLDFAGDGAPRWPDEFKWCGFLNLSPAWSAHLSELSGREVKRIYINRTMGRSLARALHSVEIRGLIPVVRSFDGCFNIRPVRGGRDWSWHAYALALDFNAASLPLGSEERLPADFVECFTREGFVYGAGFARKDPMHFQYGREV